MDGAKLTSSRFVRMFHQLGEMISLGQNFVAIRECTRFVFLNRQLILEMAKKDLLERSNGQAFGYFWIFFQPILMISVYSFIFVVIVRMRHPEAVSGPDYGIYVLSGLLVWLSSSEALARSAVILRSNASLIKQVIFPIEVLPISTVLVAFSTQGIFLVGFFSLKLMIGSTIGWASILLPLVVILQFAGLIGLALMISAVSVYFKDVKDVLQAYLTVAVYTLPIFFTAGQTPPPVRWIFEWNPFSPMINVYRDVLYTGKIEHPISWLFFVGLSMMAFALGFRFFRRVKVYFGSVM